MRVREAELLGFSRGECIRGHEKGLVLVRSIWLAKVELNEWVPEHETLERKLVQPERVLAELALDVFLPLHHRGSHCCWPIEGVINDDQVRTEYR